MMNNVSFKFLKILIYRKAKRIQECFVFFLQEIFILRPSAPRKKLKLIKRTNIKTIYNLNKCRHNLN